METRIEHDLLGDREVPSGAYFGVHSLRALENFSISGVSIAQWPELINALAAIKAAAASANCELGLLDRERADAIVRACAEISGGALRDQFVVDLIQGGAGTSTNMNMNEVVANRALELLGREKGTYGYVHPNEHVNMSQSTNDVYPTALRLATYHGIASLLATMASLREAFELKASEFRDVLKVGRTQLQDAVPMTLGQEFSTYAVMIAEDEQRLEEAARLICEVNLGATAIGTGLTAHEDYARVVCGKLRDLTGVPVTTSPDLVEATQDCGSFVQVSSVLKRVAVKLSKICNDLRLLSSGPRTGFGEINLPPVQAGSSIMPGKVNPVIPEVVNQIAFEVIGNDVTVTFAAEGGQLQLNAFEPIIGYSIFKSLKHLSAGCEALSQRCVRGITANHDKLSDNFARSISIVTALNPIIGYSAATDLAAEALETGESVVELVMKRELLTRSQLDSILRPEVITKPGLVHLDK